MAKNRKYSGAFFLEGSAAVDYSPRSIKIRCRPFLKWVGGKGQLLSELRSRVPHFSGRYFEPFIGGGALFFELQPKDARISDTNEELINAYLVVRDDVENLIKDLGKHIYEPEYYYRIRNIDRTSEYTKWSPVQKASRLIYLNKTCFNGLFRVNSKGHFNTPFGKYTNPRILDEENLRACSATLKGVEIVVSPFEAIKEIATPADFVYFDPPYVPLSVTSSFTGYTKDGFEGETQTNLFNLCKSLDSRGIKFLLSNSSAPFIIDLYKEFKVELVQATRALNSKVTGRGAINEVMVSNL